MPGRLTIDAPLDCVIRAAGALDARWSERLGGLRVRAWGDAGDGPVTELSGTLLDQAALVGVLVTLYDLGFPLLSVACRAAPGPPSPDAGRAAPAGPRRTRSRGRWDLYP
jgi:hypothetical protein